MSLITDWIKAAPENRQEVLLAMYHLLKSALPQAYERLSYGMPTFWWHEDLVYFIANQKGMGFYPTSGPIAEFADDLKAYHPSKGAVNFLYTKPLPAALILKMVQARWQVVSQKYADAGPVKPPAAKASIPSRKRQTRAANPMPKDITALLKTKNLTDAYAARPPYQRNDYLGWIAQAKQPATRQKRLKQMLAELASGDVYMKMAWHPRKGTAPKA